jgi:hypothetical protein
MPLPRPLLEKMAAERNAAEVEAKRDRNRDLAWSALRCLLWSALGILCILWSAHTTDAAYGRIAFYGGLVVGNAGIVYTLLGVYKRGLSRGDW